MKGRGNPWLLLYLLLVIYDVRAAGQETSTSPPGPITSAWEQTNSSGNKFGTTATNLPVTESTPENANVSAATNQSILHGSVAATASATTRNPNYTDTAQTTGLSTTVSTRNYSELTTTGPTKPTPEMSDTPTTASTLNSNHSSSTGQPKTATGPSAAISVQPNSTALNNSTTSRTEPAEETTPVILHQTNTTSLYTIHPSSTTASYTNLSSRTEPITQHTSDISQPLTTTVLINNQTSSTEHPTQNTSDVSAHPTATHGPDISNSSVSPANTTSSASVNSTKHMSSTTDAAKTMSVNSTRFPADTTHLPESTTNSSAYTTGIVTTKHPTSSLTAVTATTHNGSAVTNSSRTETPVTSTNSTFTTQSYTSNQPQTTSSTFVTNTTAPAEDSTKAPNGTTWGMSSLTTKIVPSGSSISPSTRNYTEGSHGTTITDSNPCRNVTCPSMSICVPKSPGYNCITGRTFPGQLNLKSRNYTPEMANERSPAFIATALEIEKVLKRILENKSGYIRSAVRKLMSGSVIADVENIFLRSSSVTSNEIANEINTFIGSCADCGPLTKGDAYEEQDLCSLDTCDNMTTICSSSNGVFDCKCKDGYYQHFLSERSCLACPSGYKLENKTCVKCPFGYAGFNCDDSSLLAVVVISCVLGSLLLILLISLSIACYRSKKLQRESYEHEAYLMWPKQEFPKIPRVTMNRDSTQMDYGSKNILVDNEMSNGNTVSPEAPRMEGDLKTFSNKNPTRYSYLNHGQTNPYFVNEDN